MNIWYINHYAGGPGIGNAYRPYELAAAWQRQGHQASVFVASYHHLQSGNLVAGDGVATGHLQAGVLHAGGVRYVAIAARRYAGNGVARLLNMADFTRGLYGAAKRVPSELAKPDAIIVSSPHPFAIYPARSLARRFDAKLVFEIRDLWPLSITEITGASQYHPFVQACARAERFAYRNADLIASVLPRADQYLKAVGFGHKPFVFVPNGVSSSAASRAPVTSVTGQKALLDIARWRAQNKTVLIHAGSMGPPNGLLPLIDAVCGADAEELRARLAIILIGSGPLEDDIRTSALAARCEISVVGRVPKDEVGAIVALASFGYAGVNNIPNLYKFGVSLNKVADYLSAGLPAFLPIAACGEPISEARAGIVKAVTCADDMRAALHQMVSLSEVERRAMGERGRQYMQAEYNFDGIARRYVTAIDACGRRGAGEQS